MVEVAVGEEHTSQVAMKCPFTEVFSTSKI